jgi:ComF family protein
MRPAQDRPFSRLGWVVDWLYPPRCRACGGRIHGPDCQYLCASCWAQIQLVSHPLCGVCGRPFLAAGGDHLCGACFTRAPHFLWARAWACYPRDHTDEDPLRKIVQKFKYGRKVSLGKPLGRLMTAGCAEFLSNREVDMIVAVPLHPKRLRWRGFNQSVLLAREVSRAYRIPLNLAVLTREKETRPQTELSEDERRSNVRGAFSVHGKEAIKGKKILLIDDVYTSGATVNECSRVLMQARAKEVGVLTLARAI